MLGPHAVLEALRAGRPLNKIWLAPGGRRPEYGEIVRLARENGVPVQPVVPAYLQRLAGSKRAQGVAAQAAPLAYATLEAILQRATERQEPPLVLALDQIEDPQNLGAVLRSAEATGVHGVVIPARRAAPATAAVARASAGALAHVPLARVGNLARTLEELGEAGLTVVGLAGEAETSLFSLSLVGPLVLVVGSEGRGLRRLVREKCHYLACLPRRGRVNSLNAAAAAAVALYEVLRQRYASENSP